MSKETKYLPVSTEGCTNTTFSPHIASFDKQYEQFKMSFINKTHEDLNGVYSDLLTGHQIQSPPTEYVQNLSYFIPVANIGFVNVWMGGRDLNGKKLINKTFKLCQLKLFTCLHIYDISF